MAYKSKGGCTPITAKIQKTTKGGMVTQPILNMGAPVKMKMSSPAKSEGKNTNPEQERLKKEISHMSSAMESYQKRGGEQNASDLRHLKKAQAKLKSLQNNNNNNNAAKDKSNYQKKLDQYKKDVSTLDANIKSASKNFSPRGMDSAMNRNVRQSGRIKSFENELYNYDKKNKPGSTEGYTAKEYAIAKAGGTYKPKTKKVSYDTAYKNRDQKKYGSMTKADYIKEAKRQNASKKAGKGWDAKPKREKAAAAPTIKSIGIQPVSVETKLTGKIDTAIVKPKGKKVEPTEKQARQTKSIDKKLTKAKAARDAGNIKKAERKERAASNKAARIARKAAK